MTAENRYLVNKSFVVKFFDSVGGSRLIGAGQMYKVIGVEGEKVANQMADAALLMNENESVFSFEFRGCSFRFSRRKKIVGHEKSERKT